MSYLISHIAKSVNAEVIAQQDVDIKITELVTDTRKVFKPEQSVFFAIKGQYKDGHQYLTDAYKKGIRCFILSDLKHIESIFTNCWILKVNDVLDSLQRLVILHRNQFQIPIVGITGSNGKTIVKDWLSQMLSIDKNVSKSPKSYNSQIGVPLSVWTLDEHDHLGIFEAGISLPNEMEKLEKIIQPTIGILTNIGPPHAENFESDYHKASEKIKLFTHCNVLIYCSDYEVINQAVKNNLSENVKRITWTLNDNVGLKIKIEHHQNNHTSSIAIENEVFNSPFGDKASIENIIHCIFAMKELGYDAISINQRLNILHRISMRMEIKKGKNNCTIINDSYSSDLGSLGIALDSLGQLNQHPQKTLILSDILQSGMNSDELYQKVNQLVKSHKVRRVIGVGQEISRFKLLFPVESMFFKTTEEFLLNIKKLEFRNEDILIKGARLFEFEKIVQVLEEKTHHTVLEVNLNAMVHNLNYFRKKLKQDTKLMVMVKASSYGTGSYEIANLLQYYQIDYLAVAYADEGVTLRNAGIKTPIMVMNPESYRYDIMVDYNLEPEIYSFDSLQQFVSFSDGKDNSPGIHIKLDSGMHRLGFDPGDEEKIASLIPDSIKVLSVFSHMAASDDPKHDEFSNGQIELLNEFYDNLSKRLGYFPLKHILNSGGIYRFPHAMMDMVRLGVGLYGVGVNDQEQKNLEQVIRLKTIISQVKHINEGESVGYGRSYIADSPMKIATVPIGYADGLRRALSNGKGKMIIHDQPVPIIGKICMDMTMLDVTGIECKAGDEVIVIGEGNTIIDMAKDLNTIPYEILTGISERVKRTYIQE